MIFYKRNQVAYPIIEPREAHGPLLAGIDNEVILHCMGWSLFHLVTEQPLVSFDDFTRL